MAISPHPAGGDQLKAEMEALMAAGYGHVTSLLEPDETEDLGLAKEEEICAEVGVRYHHLRTRDGSIPGFDRYATFIAQLAEELHDGRGLLIHCRHGIGRSGLVAIGLLLQAQLPYVEAVERVAKARGALLPSTSSQGRLLRAYARLLYEGDLNEGH